MKTRPNDTDSEELYKLPKINFDLSFLLSPKSFAIVVSPLVVAILGAASRGDVFLYLVLGWLNWDKLSLNGGNVAGNSTNETDITSINEAHDVQITPDSDVIRSDIDEFLHQYNLDNLYYAIAGAITLSYVVFFGLGGFLQWHYYIQRRDEPEKWKCQPKRFLSKENERHEILLGASNLALGASLSGVLATLVLNGADISTLYYDVSDYGCVYFVVSTVLTFLFQDASAYYIHRTLHWPFFYKRFHKMHHRYHSPTAFSAVALHPVEFLTLQFALVIPMFVVPIHFVGYLGCIMYTYYYGMIDHSGIDLEAVWPWQPPVRFHDDHHKYFHVNFGFNTLLFDRLHDTLRKKTRVYSEDIFGGKGEDKTKIHSRKSD